MQIINLTPIGNLETSNVLGMKDKINEIIRFCNAMEVECTLAGTGNKYDGDFSSDNDVIKRFGEWFPKDFVR